MAAMDNRIVVGIIAATVLLVGVGVVIGSWGRGQNATGPVEAQTAEVTSKDWVKGKEKAAVTLIEYGDFQCPSCGAYYPVVKQLSQEEGEDLRVVFRQYPLVRTHDKAFDAAKAAEAAGGQGKFWEMHDQLFENQKAWSESGKYLELFEEYAQAIGLDVEKWREDLSSSEIEKKIQEDRSLGDKIGVGGTPTFVVNGIKLVVLPGSLEKFKEIIETARAQAVKSESKENGGEAVHEHADVAVFQGGRQLDLTGEEFMEKDEAIHFHDGNGKILHKHQRGASLGQWAGSLGLRLEQTSEVRWWVNREERKADWKQYEFSDLDRILLVSGEFKPEMLAAVGDESCIYSEKCPERGEPPTEGCVGGLETPCE